MAWVTATVAAAATPPLFTYSRQFSMVQAAASIVYVNAATGSDRGAGSRQSPLKSLSQALDQARSGSEIHLEPGLYSQERFPLTVPPGVSVLGTGRGATIRGGGPLATEAMGSQSVAVVLGEGSQLRNVTVTNPLAQGIGLWLERGTALVTRCRLIGCGQDGMVAAGQAIPVAIDNEFSNNRASGLVLLRQAKGEIRQNHFTEAGHGIALSGQTAPLIIDNVIEQNRIGLILSQATRPVLRQNQVRRNRATGLWLQDQAQPDLGQSQDSGSNQIEKNGQWDLRNDSARPVVTVGNQLNPNRVRGAIDYLASEVPDTAAVPTMLLGRVTPEPSLPVSPPPVSPPLNLNSRFADVIGHWSAPFVDAMAAADLVKGFLDGSFRPDSPVTRAQFAALIMATFPSQGSSQRRFQPFRDVPTGFWARTAIYQAQARGFLAGFPDSTFRPNDPMIRAQALVALINGLRLGQGRAADLSVYQDRAQIPPYAVEEIAMATRRSIVVNYPQLDELRPMEPINRAETTALVYQCLVNLGQMPAVSSPFIVGLPASTARRYSSHWADVYMQPLLAQQLTGGVSGSLDSPLTRAQFATLLTAAFQPEPVRSQFSFRDVPRSYWAYGSIQTAYQAEFMSGFPDHTFAPENEILKLQVLLSLVNGLRLEPQWGNTLKQLSRYSDRPQIPRYGADAVATATRLGLVFNHPDLNRLTPNRVATLGEAAAMIYQGLVLAKRMPPAASPYQVLPS